MDDLPKVPPFTIREKFSVGRLEYPRHDDEQYPTQEAAELHGIGMMVTETPLGVWENETGELRAIIYENTVFRP